MSMANFHRNSMKLTGVFSNSVASRHYNNLNNTPVIAHYYLKYLHIWVYFTKFINRSFSNKVSHHFKYHENIMVSICTTINV